MELDAVMLARMQFAFTIAFHIIFPSFTIGLSAWIATLLVIWRRTGDGPLSRPRPVLDQDLRRVLRHGRRVGHRHVLRVRHQLEPFLACRRQRRRAADRLRGADRLLPRGDLPRHPAVRLEPGAARPACAGGDPGRGRARCSRPSGSCRPIPGCSIRPATRSRTASPSRRLAGRDVQPDLPASLLPHGASPPTSPPPSSSSAPAPATCSPERTGRTR